MTYNPGKYRQSAKPRRSSTISGEDGLQVQCITWFKAQYPKYAGRIFHPANGGSRNAIEAVKLQKMGVLPGVCDIIITIPSGDWCGLFIELKYGNNSLSVAQERFIQQHEKDYSCHVVYSVDEFIKVVRKYLNK